MNNIDEGVISSSLDGSVGSLYSRTGFHSFTEVYDTYHRQIRSYVRKRVSDNSDIEDLVQGVFLGVFQRADDFVPRSSNSSKSFNAFIFAIAKNTVAGYFREKGKRIFEKEIRGRGSCVSQFSRELYNGYAIPQEEVISWVKEVLPDTYRDVFLLRVFGGYSYKEIAKKLGINARAARKRQLRARNFLKSYLEQHDLDGVPKSKG